LINQFAVLNKLRLFANLRTLIMHFLPIRLRFVEFLLPLKLNFAQNQSYVSVTVSNRKKLVEMLLISLKNVFSLFKIRWRAGQGLSLWIKTIWLLSYFIFNGWYWNWYRNLLLLLIVREIVWILQQNFYLNFSSQSRFFLI
jgi:hypothetical protein